MGVSSTPLPLLLLSAILLLLSARELTRPAPVHKPPPPGTAAPGFMCRATGMFCGTPWPMAGPKAPAAMGAPAPPPKKAAADEFDEDDDDFVAMDDAAADSGAGADGSAPPPTPAKERWVPPASLSSSLFTYAFYAAMIAIWFGDRICGMLGMPKPALLGTLEANKMYIIGGLYCARAAMSF